jgi:hypothetical protein
MKDSICRYIWSLIFLFTILVGGGILVGRYLMYREVTCLTYHSCNRILDEGSFCYDIVDNQGTTSVTTLEFSSRIIRDLPSKCWTNSYDVTAYEPIKVLKIFLIVVFSIMALYVIGTYCYRKIYPNRYIENGAYWGISIYWTLVSIIISNILITLIVYIYYESKYIPVTCTKYQVKRAIYDPYVNSVQIFDNSTQKYTDGVEMEYGTMQGTLPANCWTDGKKVTQYNPQSILLWSIVMSIIMYFVALGYYFSDKTYRMFGYANCCNDDNDSNDSNNSDAAEISEHHIDVATTGENASYSEIKNQTPKPTIAMVPIERTTVYDAEIDSPSVYEIGAQEL